MSNYLIFQPLLYYNSFHPYLFFNQDRDTFTFMGFCVDDDCNAIDPNNGKTILPNVFSKDLKSLLKAHFVDFSDNYLNW